LIIFLPLPIIDHLLRKNIRVKEEWIVILHQKPLKKRTRTFNDSLMGH